MTGTPIRPLTRLLDASVAALWVISPVGKLVYLSAGIERLLGVSPESLLDRRCVAGSPISDDPLDEIAAILSAPPGFATRGTASLRITPPTAGNQKSTGQPVEVRFVRIGEADHALTIAIAGSFDDRTTDVEVQDAVAIRQRIDDWRRQSEKRSAAITLGDSSAARRLRHRLKVASLSRSDVLIVGPNGCGSAQIAAGLSQESTVTVDGPLMDPELLDATLSPITNTLTDVDQSQATAIIRDLEQMPLDAQTRLAHWHSQFAGRLRLIGLSKTSRVMTSTSDNNPDNTGLHWPDVLPDGLSAVLADLFCASVIPVDAIASRVADIPLIATALLDARRSAGETQADRINRAAMDAMVLYPWPGNFDELNHSIGHASKSAPGHVIAPENLPLVVRSFRPGNPIAKASMKPIELDAAVRKFEQKLIANAVEAADGNRAEAARRLGISRARLLRKLDDAP